MEKSENAENTRLQYNARGYKVSVNGKNPLPVENRVYTNGTGVFSANWKGNILRIKYMYDEENSTLTFTAFDLQVYARSSKQLNREEQINVVVNYIVPVIDVEIGEEYTTEIYQSSNFVEKGINPKMLLRKENTTAKLSVQDSECS